MSAVAIASACSEPPQPNWQFATLIHVVQKIRNYSWGLKHKYFRRTRTNIFDVTLIGCCCYCLLCLSFSASRLSNSAHTNIYSSSSSKNERTSHVAYFHELSTLWLIVLLLLNREIYMSIRPRVPFNSNWVLVCPIHFFPLSLFLRHNWHHIFASLPHHNKKKNERSKHVRLPFNVHCVHFENFITYIFLLPVSTSKFFVCVLSSARHKIVLPCRREDQTVELSINTQKNLLTIKNLCVGGPAGGVELLTNDNCNMFTLLLQRGVEVENEGIKFIFTRLLLNR